MPPLHLLSSLAVRGAFEAALLPGFGRAVAPVWAPTTVLLAQLASGAPADLIVVTDEAMDRLATEAAIDPATRSPLARSSLGLAVAPGTPHPPIDTLEGFTRALLAARSVAYSLAGASGIHFRALIERLGIADAVNARATTIAAGFTAERLLTGEADLAVQQLSELMVVPGVEIVGRFPDEAQQYALFSAAVLTRSTDPEGARQLLAHLAAPVAAEAYRASGLEPWQA